VCPAVAVPTTVKPTERLNINAELLTSEAMLAKMTAARRAAILKQTGKEPDDVDAPVAEDNEADDMAKEIAAVEKEMTWLKRDDRIVVAPSIEPALVEAIEERDDEEEDNTEQDEIESHQEIQKLAAEMKKVNRRRRPLLHPAPTAKVSPAHPTLVKRACPVEDDSGHEEPPVAPDPSVLCMGKKMFTRGK
jgi:hypothetical protein